MSKQTLEEVKRIWRNADAVCFDVDSTVMKDEALDELAKFCGVGQEVQEWYKRLNLDILEVGVTSQRILLLR